MPASAQLSLGNTTTVQVSTATFLGSFGNANTIRSYGIGVRQIAERLGNERLLAAVGDDEIGEAMKALWGTATEGTWSVRRTSVTSWLLWCRDHGCDAPSVPAWAKRPAEPDLQTPLLSKTAIDRLIARRDVSLREKTLWQMLYETAARADEILDLNIEELDLGRRRARVRTTGSVVTHRQGSKRSQMAPEPVSWEAGTADFLSLLLRGRRRGPVFVTARHPANEQALTSRDVCPDTGLTRLSRGQAQEFLDAYTAWHGAGTGWDLSQFRHSALTHLVEAGASLMMLMTKSRHRNPENLRRYLNPSSATAGLRCAAPIAEALCRARSQK